MKVMQLTMGILAMGFFASGIAMAGDLLDIEQTGSVNVLDVIQSGGNNKIVGADVDGNIINALSAQQSNSVGGNSLTIKQTGGNNQLGFYQEGGSATTTTANIQQLGGDNDLGVHVVVNGEFLNNLTVTQNGGQMLTIKEVINSEDYNVTITQP